eukprot:jgi/Mesvir1/9742/Mv12206-RA.1
MNFGFFHFGEKPAKETIVKVQPGDSLHAIADDHGVSLEDLKRANGIRNVNRIKVGDEIKVPPGGRPPKKQAQNPFALFAGIGNLFDAFKKPVISVKPGDSLWSIAHAHGVTIEALRTENRLPEGYVVKPGHELTLPRKTNQRQPFASLSHGAQQAPPPNELALCIGQLAAQMPLLGPHLQAQRKRMAMRRPVDSGWLSSHYGWGARRKYFHHGVDIAVEVGTDIRAAHDGKVSYSGWMGSYGKTVCIDHGNGLETLYAHCSDLYVKKGQPVRHGDCIATSGDTGRSTGPHVHFEVRKNGDSQDPALHLPDLMSKSTRVAYAYVTN